MAMAEQQQNPRIRGPPKEPLPPCTALFIAGLPVAVPGTGWKKPLEKAFGKYSPGARGKPRIRVARNSFNNAVGHGWIENVLIEKAAACAAALDGVIKLDGQPIAVSACIDRRDALCPKLSYAARQQLALPAPEGGLPEPLEQPTAERIAELLLLFANVGGSGGSLPAVRLLDASAGEGLGTAVFASAFTAVHAVETDPTRFAALTANFGPAAEKSGGSGGGSLATAGAQVSLHSTLEAGIAASTAALEQQQSLLGFFQLDFSAVASAADDHSAATQWSLERFRTLLSAGCGAVMALLPLSVDFETLAEALVQLPADSTEAATDERPHPFRLEFSRPSYTAEGVSRSGLWQDWQLILVTATPPAEASQSGPAAQLVFGNAKLDPLVGVLLQFYSDYCKEHRPFFYDWEKKRTIQLSRWKGAKLAGDHDGLTLRELRAAQAPPEPEPEPRTEEDAAVVEQEKTTGGVGAAVSQKSRGCRLVWVLIVDGGTCDRKAGTARKASWVGFDKGYRSRRDALARSVTAALWSEPASRADCTPAEQHTYAAGYLSAYMGLDLESIKSLGAKSQQEGGVGDEDDEGPARVVHGDCECHIIHEQTGELLSISPEFARAWRRGGPPTEARLLKAFDDAARDVGSSAAAVDRSVPGLTVHKDTTSVAEATARIFEVAGLAGGAASDQSAAVIELHEDKERFLPVYETQSKGQDAGLDALVLVLGCVQDHSEAVATVVATGKALPAVGGRHLAVNVGPVSEFSSKVIHLLQAHHTADRLIPAVIMQLKQAEAAGAPAEAEAARTARVEALASAPAAAPAPAPLHFWVWCEGVELAHLPTTYECRQSHSSPSLTVPHRASVWRVPNIVLAAFAKSHGAYDNVRLSLILDDAVVTVDGSVVTKHMTERGWGALTEHHTLVSLRDAIDADGRDERPAGAFPVLTKSLAEALEVTVDGPGTADAAATTTTGCAGTFIVMDKQAKPDKEPLQQLPLYESAKVDSSGTSAWNHFLLVPEGLSAAEVANVVSDIAGAGEVVRCGYLDGGAAAEPARTIVALQTHHNCGVLVPALVELCAQSLEAKSGQCAAAAVADMRVVDVLAMPATERQELIRQLPALLAACEMSDGFDAGARDYAEVGAESVAQRDPEQERALAVVEGTPPALIGLIHGYIEEEDAKHEGGPWLTVPNVFVTPSRRRRGVARMLLGALRTAHPTGAIELEVCDQSASGMATLAALGWRRNEGNADCVLQRALSVDTCVAPSGLQLDTTPASTADERSSLVLLRVSDDSEDADELIDEIMMTLMGWAKLEEDPRVSMYCADLSAGVAEDLEELEVYLLRKEGAPVGLVHVEPAEPGSAQRYLMNMVISPEHRRQGLGSLALQALTWQSCAAGTTELVTECTKPEGVAFFKKNSFTVQRSFSQWQLPLEPE